MSPASYILPTADEGLRRGRSVGSASGPFADSGLEAIPARVHVDSTASRRVLEAVGFRPVGAARNREAGRLGRRFRLVGPRT